MWSTICAATVLATTLFAASAYAEDVRGAIEATNATFAKHVAAKDSAALAGLYTEDAAVIAPGAPVARGTAAIEAFWKGAMAGIASAKLTTSSVESAGDLAMEEGEATLVDNAGKSNAARYIVVWKRVGDVWKLHRDIWN
jgi:ketosteroid isomerase-like protein